MENQEWMKDKRLQGIDPEKLKLLMTMTNDSGGKGKNELMPYLLAAAANSKAKGLSFTPQEADTIIEVMKKGKNKEEIAKIEKIRMLMRILH